jgi:hypothetical protein
MSDEQNAAPEATTTGGGEPAPDRHAVLTEQFEQLETEAPAEGAPKADEKPKGERARDATGKFVAGDKTATVPPNKQAQAPVQPPDAAQQQATEPAWKKPPKSWKADYHADWSKVDPRLQEYVHQREEQMRSGVEGLISKGQFADAMQRVIAPHMNTMRGLGVTPVQAVDQLMRADQMLRSGTIEQRRAYLGHLARQYGIPLDGPAPQGGAPDQQQPFDPRLHALTEQLTQLRGEVTGWRQMQEQQTNAGLQSEIEKFATDPKNEHFEAVRETMVKLLAGGVAETLQDAYDRAIRLDDKVFAAVQAKQAEAQRIAADQAAKSARAAAVSVRSSTPGARTPTKATDRRSMLAEQVGGLSERL